MMCPQPDGHIPALHAATSICGWAQLSHLLWWVPSAVAAIAMAGMAFAGRTTGKLVPKAKIKARRKANLGPSFVRIGIENIEARPDEVEGAP